MIAQVANGSDSHSTRVPGPAQRGEGVFLVTGIEVPYSGLMGTPGGVDRPRLLIKAVLKCCYLVNLYRSLRADDKAVI